jgi:hypothetical protein
MVGSLRGLNRSSGLAARLKPCPSTNLSKAIRHTLRRRELRRSFVGSRSLCERLRCLRMTIPGRADGAGWDGAHGSPDSAAQRFWCAILLPWGKFGALQLGEEEMYSEEFGASRAAGGMAGLAEWEDRVQNSLPAVLAVPTDAGVLRLRMRFASRNACCAQDDSAKLRPAELCASGPPRLRAELRQNRAGSRGAPVAT